MKSCLTIPAGAFNPEIADAARFLDKPPALRLTGVAHAELF